MSKVDLDEVVAFITEKGLKGPEGDVGKDGQYDLVLKTSSAELNNVGPMDLTEKKLCQKYV
jgi:hypothetical protein